MTRKPALARCVSGLIIGMLLQACSNDALQPGEERPGADEAEITASMIDAIKTITLARAENNILPRLNQAKSLGCLNAKFAVRDDLSPELSQGVFEPGRTYDALVRFANASTEDDRKADFRGLSIKLFNVQGSTLWGVEREQHFLLNSHPVLFAEDPAEFLAFLEASADDALWKFFVNPLHWDALLTVIRGRDEITSPYTIRYWSTTPFRHGEDDSVAVKYSATPCEEDTAATTEERERHPDFLRDAMADSLAAGPVCFDFAVQFQTDPETMPIEDASVIWDEDESPFRPVATLTIAEQNFDTEQALMDCEQQTFNPWQSLPAHQPLGGINRVRRAVYSEAAAFRLQQSQYP